MITVSYRWGKYNDLLRSLTMRMAEQRNDPIFSKSLAGSLYLQYHILPLNHCKLLEFLVYFSILVCLCHCESQRVKGTYSKRCTMKTCYCGKDKYFDHIIQSHV